VPRGRIYIAPAVSVKAAVKPGRGILDRNSLITIDHIDPPGCARVPMVGALAVPPCRVKEARGNKATDCETGIRKVAHTGVGSAGGRVSVGRDYLARRLGKRVNILSPAQARAGGRSPVSTFLFFRRCPYEWHRQDCISGLHAESTLAHLSGELCPFVGKKDSMLIRNGDEKEHWSAYQSP